MGRTEQHSPRPLENKLPKVYSVPRRFGIGTIMGVATAYALVIWFMQKLDAPLEVIIINAIFLTIVGAMQMIMNKTPRWASMFVGVVCVSAVIVIAVFRHGLYFPDPFEIFLNIASALVFGSFYGYVGGALVAGVFLLMDAVARFFSRSDRAGRPGSQ